MIGSRDPACSRRRPIVRAILRTALALAALGAVAAGEWTLYAWSREETHPRTRPLSGGRLGVLLLGYGNRGQRLNGTNRGRVAVALRTVRREPDAVIVCSGGPTTGDGSEASKLAHALRARGFTGEIRLEERSRSTGENVTLSAPLLEDCARIAVASQIPHALKARIYLRRHRPDLADRLVPAADWRPLEHPAIRLGYLIYGMKVLPPVRAQQEPGAR